jgi:L-aminopeptidase/D-esterase-like protein
LLPNFKRGLHVNIFQTNGRSSRKNPFFTWSYSMSFGRLLAVVSILLNVATGAAIDQNKPKLRARDLGVPFDGLPGRFNAITDVAGVEVGHTTLRAGKPPLKVGVGPVRTGVTAILPRGKKNLDPVCAAWFSLNGNGEMTGTTWIEESGFLEGPVLLTNTLSVGTVRNAVIKWAMKRNPDSINLPVVAEIWDGAVNDIRGFHVKTVHVFRALDGARGGKVQEGNVGGGTGATCYDFSGGIGTASRKTDESNPYTIGVLVQANQGDRKDLLIAGVPAGKEIPGPQAHAQNKSSIIVVVATDAPLLPHQLKRLARRASLGVGRTGTITNHFSGEIFLAFSTANPGIAKPEKGKLGQLKMLPNDAMDPLFAATVEATEEAIINALVAASPMTGIDGTTYEALPHSRLKELLRKYNRLATPARNSRQKQGRR